MNVVLQMGTEAVLGKLSYFDRYLGASDSSLYWQVHRSRRTHPGYDAAKTGAIVELGTPLGANWTQKIRLRAEQVDLDGPSPLHARQTLSA